MHGPSLNEVLRSLETGALTVWAAPAEPATPLRDVVIHDATAGLDAGPGDVLLAVGAGDAAQTAALLDDAGGEGVTALVVRPDPGARELLVGAARRAGVALLTLNPTIGWAQITSQLRSALSTFGVRLDHRSADLPEQDLVGFANALADVIGGSVIVFSPQQDVVAASRLQPHDDQMRRQAILDQHGPMRYREVLRSRGVYQKLWRCDEVVEVDPVPELGADRRLAVAIRAGEEILGSIWVAENPGGFPDHAGATLMLATAPAGRLLLRHRAQAQVQRFAEGVARQLLAGETDAKSAAGWLDVDPNRPCAVVSCAFAEAPDAADTGAERRLAELLATQLSAYRRPAVPVTWRGRVDVILCDLDGQEALLRTARDLVSRTAYALRRPILGAVGAIAPGLAQAGRSRSEADLVLRALRRGSPDQTVVASLGDVRAAAELLVLSDLISNRPELHGGPVAKLIQYDRTHQTSFAASLSAFLEAFGDVVKAARAVNVHPNTLRYRLRRLTEICGIDLSDPDERLMAALLLRTTHLDDLTTKPAQVGAPA